MKLLITLLFMSYLMSPGQAFACGSTGGCDPCSADKDMTWNPDGQYVTARLQRFYDLDDALPAAYKAGDLAKVKTLTAEDLSLAAIYRCNWNYGNAVHDANRYLGLVSLKEGDVDQAAAYLVEAGKSTGSPQLDTFGPDLDLANALVQAGKTDAVKTYLAEVKTFWTMDNGQITRWTAEINQGKKPDLSGPPNLVPDSTKNLIIFMTWAQYSWPALITIIFLLMKRAWINRKVWYLLTGAGCSYASMFLLDWSVNSLIQRWVVQSSNSSVAPLLLLSILSFLMIWSMPIIAMVVVTRFFRSKSQTSVAG